MSLFATAVEWASMFAADLAGMFDIGGSGIEIDFLDGVGSVPPVIGGGKPEEPEPDEDECGNMGTPGNPVDTPPGLDFSPPSPGDWTIGGDGGGGEGLGGTGPVGI